MNADTSICPDVPGHKHTDKFIFTVSAPSVARMHLSCVVCHICDIRACLLIHAECTPHESRYVGSHTAYIHQVSGHILHGQVHSAFSLPRLATEEGACLLRPEGAPLEPGVQPCPSRCTGVTPASHLLDHDTVDACVLEATCIVKQVQPAQHQ